MIVLDTPNISHSASGRFAGVTEGSLMAFSRVR